MAVTTNAPVAMAGRPRVVNVPRVGIGIGKSGELCVGPVTSTWLLGNCILCMDIDRPYRGDFVICPIDVQHV